MVRLAANQSYFCANNRFDYKLLLDFAAATTMTANQSPSDRMWSSEVELNLCCCDSRDSIDSTKIERNEEEGINMKETIS